MSDKRPSRRLPATLQKVERALATHAGGLPDVVEEAPWGHRAFKVRKKTFLFMGSDGGVLSLSVKLPDSAGLALELPFTEPTGYGLGRSGWVSARFTKGDAPVPLLLAWIDESYRHFAPKRRSTGAKAKAPAAKKPRASRTRPARQGQPRRF